MTKILKLIAAAVLVLGVSSCNFKIDNPKASNFVGTWDLEKVEVVATSGSVTSSTPSTLDYLVITKDKISVYEADKLSREGSFSVKDNMIFVNGTATYKVAEFKTREMTLTQDGFGLLVSEYRYYYKKR